VGLILPISVLDGLGAGLVSSTLTVLFSDIIRPELRGVSIGFYRTFMDIGGIVGPIAFMLVATQNSVHLSFWIGALLLLTMAGLISTIRREPSGC
jgi:MFS family permease